ncbi:ANTAR domain-containing protein (plasmid) [Photobacterium sp. GJ3]|uniref:ANTAR domain-containing response regulator n=1 Tax=Photobacterium sp. GJ3 TaxID=2829502 RepID=UPI001B8C8A72|nr:ANTAR domain-containing protein [Photobacterium sp. GJ3]QUJ69685.1 ANTAR domain-containing protein [Photobacterium sp. GJ3]
MNATTSINTIVLISDNERTCRQVEKASARMGIHCHTRMAYQREKTDLVLIDIQYYFNAFTPQTIITDTLPIVGLLSHGSPTEVERATQIGALAVICKPIHQSGLYAAFHMAKTLNATYNQLRQQLKAMQTRHQLRHTVINAVGQLMTEYNLSSEAAYQQLQRESMRRNVPIEQACVELTQGYVTDQRFKAGRS